MEDKQKQKTQGLAAKMAETCIAVRLRLANRVITQVFDRAFRPFGIKTSQANILVALALGGAMSPTDIGALLRYEKSTLSRNLARMGAKGWIADETEPGRRNHLVSLTPAGEELIIRLYPAWEKAQEESAAMLGEDGMDAVITLGDRLWFGAESEE